MAHGSGHDVLRLQFGEPCAEESVRETGHLGPNLAKPQCSITKDLQDRTGPATSDQLDRVLEVGTVVG
jgi:hypothetical protein